MAIAIANNVILAFELSLWHIAVFLLVVLLLFGGKKLPELARGLARGLRIFRDEIHGVKSELDEPSDRSAGASPPPADKPKDEKK